MPPHASAPSAAKDKAKISLEDVPVVKYEHDFHWIQTDEPHATRRKLILAKHPEIATLFVKEPRTFLLTVAAFGLQMCMANWASTAEFWQVFIAAYVIAGTINGMLQLIMHELCHNLCFEAVWANQALAIFANLATGAPSAISFKRYHLEHHQYQGVDGVDMDIPSRAEIEIFSNSAIKKTFWCLLQPAFYALRPCFTRPYPLRALELANIVIQLTFDFLVIYFMGWQSFFYLFGGTLLGMGLHPAAGHFIAEHYEFVTGAETYSYYGPMNIFAVNVGYHNEHHDFPRVPWTKLPEVKRMAPEFYDHLPHHTSYIKVIWRYITDNSIGPYSRIKRSPKALSSPVVPVSM